MFPLSVATQSPNGRVGEAVGSLFLFILYKAVIAPAVLRDSFECANPDIALLVLNAMMGEIEVSTALFGVLR